MNKLESILSILPQTQCGLCNHSGCKPYAKALIAKQDTIDKCHPGGEETLSQLGEILNIQTEQYTENVRNRKIKKSTIYIDPTRCIGCTKCIQVCPVDAIVGTAKANHIVIESECTGCNLCLPACPVDCMHEQSTIEISAKKLIAKYRRERHEARNKRISQEKNQLRQQHNANKNLVKQRLQKLTKKQNA